jgi:hypothetical protein
MTLTEVKIRVTETNIIGTDRFVYDAWETRNDHGTIMTIDEKWFGRIGTRIDLSKVSHLKGMSEDRSKAVDALYKAEYKRAYAHIYAVHPELKNMKVNEFMGSVSIYRRG